MERTLRACGRTEPHAAHPWTRSNEANPSFEPYLHTCPGREDLTKHENPSVRGQAQLEEHLRDVRGFTHEAVLPGLSGAQASLRAQLAQAHATAALALSVELAVGDLEVALSRLTEELHGIDFGG